MHRNAILYIELYSFSNLVCRNGNLPRNITAVYCCCRAMGIPCVCMSDHFGSVPCRLGKEEHRIYVYCATEKKNYGVILIFDCWAVSPGISAAWMGTTNTTQRYDWTVFFLVFCREFL